MSAQTHKQTLLLLKGHPGTGKSTLAAALARRLAWPLLEKDDVKDHIYQQPNSGPLSYDILWQIVRHQLEIGLSVVVDSTLSYQRSYRTGQELATAFGTRLFVVETTVDDDTWKERLEQRLREPQTHRTAGWVGIQQLLTEYDDSFRYPIAPERHLLVDTNQPVDLLVQNVLDFLNQLP